jgi:peptidoglycan/LPS O-acetylase OafA/YrhL
MEASQSTTVQSPSASMEGLLPNRSLACNIGCAREQADRNPVIDFTKGVLVLLMVLYHWINYFVSRQGSFYKYLRFLTPSFIFITGFLIVKVYLVKYSPDDRRLHKRLLVRGCKLLMLFTCLNLAVTLTGMGPRGVALADDRFSVFIQNATSTYFSGNGRTAAFGVLVPISYLLMCSPILLMCKRHRYFLHAICGFLFFALYILSLNGLGSGHLECFTIGVLGMLLGQTTIQRVNQLIEYPVRLFAGYLVYLLALNLWKEIYPVQVVGVCLNLLLLYFLGTKSGAQGWLQKRVIVLGRYSLLSYIAQIGLILLLAKALAGMPFGYGKWIISFLGTLVLTSVAVEVTDCARARLKTADIFYKAVFA